jgi:DNA-binding XRE family transcriptional regulator
MTKPQIIESDGKPAFVVLPYDEWQRIESLIEDAEDNAALEAYHADPGRTLPADVVDALVDGKNPIRVFREHRGMTMAVLAARSGIAIPYLSQIETGKRKAGIEVLKKLAEVLAVTVDDLI